MRIGLGVLLCFAFVLALTASGAAGGLSPSATPTITAVAVGADHTCALTSSGGVECWGDNYHGTLGDGTADERGGPVTVSGLRSGVQAIATGDYFSCALTDEGAVKCWGLNRYGQLGDGTTRDRHAPVAVAGLSSGVVAIAAGSAHACALTSVGAVRCWGYNGLGALGNGTTLNRHAPVGVTGLGSGVTAIAAGLDYTCALTSGGGVECWGDNGFGKLGDGTATDRYEPVDVAGLASGVVALAAGHSHTCALTRVGGVKCWGRNAFGELGDGTTNDRYRPGGVAGLASGVVGLSAGGYHSCAVTAGGGATCWGDNSDGALGDGTTTDRYVPVDVSGLTSGVDAISAGLTHSCAVTSAGGVRCWGNNAFGELGDGTVSDRLVPVNVAFKIRCVVPEVIGKPLAAATTLIAKAHCRTGTVKKKLSPAKQKGLVLDQKPGPGARLARGARVELTVGKGPR
jgi:alpha-tubulin suppressor-like RCC1 family protein